MKKMTGILMIVTLYLILAVNFACGEQRKFNLTGLYSYEDQTYFYVEGTIQGTVQCATGNLHRVDLSSATDGPERMSRMFSIFLSYYLAGQGDIYVQFDDAAACGGPNSDRAVIYGVRLTK